MPRPPGGARTRLVPVLKTRPFYMLLAAALVASGTLAACGGDDDDSSGGISTTLKDYAFNLSTSSAGQGDVTFNIKNDGPSQHEFVVIKTDLDAAKLPYDEKDFKVNEDSSDLSKVDEKEAIDPGKSTSLTVNLKPGHYVLICNIPTHYQQGMRANFTVN
jgi:uncharacterized cupredoxin-like copper-binding protein